MKSNTRRQCLSEKKHTITTNAGLWLDKYIRDQDREGTSRRELVEEVAGILQPEWYEQWFARWKSCLEESGAKMREAQVLGRMAVGLGTDSVLETSISLHHTIGVPYIPGTALKGVASSFARKRLGDEWLPQAENGSHSIMFGNTDTAGYVTFFDAMPLPNQSKLFLDVMTVHHPEYYKTGTTPPADWDNPNPVPFLSANGRYLIALAGPEEWVEAAFSILEYSLESVGVGAKTSSGYGRLKFVGQPLVSPDEQIVDNFIREIDSLSKADVAGSIHSYYEHWKELDVDPKNKRRLAEAIVAKIKEAGREKKTKDKAWYKELIDFLE
ncbi:MAG TPA: type III-B CRISPR module RAMP protein Cmr6 [Bacillota bacterium]|nr:type III-B CRISPR module RAMP protein Cmr6 [Candidatus Fermentithermobacillaceae bacterium]HOK64820.1 type III-B CRISPR module RAMP protein Cmr6 [Bacillota bacterium]HOL12471.1 type III-B CRISPR module RAMP protein Cmr6 [Bacillota bacterium]HPP61218.1 type III-B CRISPR module RAMP protein Cmr6 [Bacillota bacterium]HPV13796.1 type III-B CRISPR module RAMP protein Cmr6 [Bacillota bacterium]